MMFNRPVEDKKVARFQQEMEKCLAQIETIWLENGKKKSISSKHVQFFEEAMKH